MNPGKLSTSKELTVIPDKKESLSVSILGRVVMYVQTLFDRSADKSDELSGNIAPIQKIVDIEDMMQYIEIKIGNMSDDWIIAEAMRLFMQFGDGKSLKNGAIEKKFFNSDIIPLIGENEHLPTTLLFPGNYNTIIEKFGILIKERLNKIRRQKLAELMDHISLRVDHLPDNDSTVKLATALKAVLGKRTDWDNQFKVEYINYPLMSFLKINEHLPEILEKDADLIIEGFLNIMKQKEHYITKKAG